MESGLEIALALLGAVALFLFGLEAVSEALGEVNGGRLEEALERGSRTPLRGLLAGILVTGLLDSSSAVIVLLVALVNARRLPFANALGVVLGANIGTTIGSQVIALDLAWLAPALLAVGVFGRLVVRAPVVRTALGVLQGLGLVFLGLELMDVAVLPLRSDPAVLAALQELTSPVHGAAAGALVTLLIQSSSATVGIAIGLASKGLLPLSAGVAVMLGAEIGTCADTLVASVGRTRSALRVGLFHLGFNVVSVAVGLLAIETLTSAAVALSPLGSLGRQLANAHVLFNVLGALVALPFVPAAARALEAWVPERTAEREQALAAA